MAARRRSSTRRSSWGCAPAPCRSPASRRRIDGVACGAAALSFDCLRTRDVIAVMSSTPHPEPVEGSGTTLDRADADSTSSMEAFAALLEALIFTPSRNGKLRLMTEFFATVPDPERGWALAALTGELGFREAKASRIRDLAMSRVDAELLGWSYDFVRDLAATVSLIWPERPVANRVPELSEIVEGLATAARSSVGPLLEGWLDALDATERWALLKLVTSGLRVGVSARLAKTALAAFGAVEIAEIEAIWHGVDAPYVDLFSWL